MTDEKKNINELIVPIEWNVPENIITPFASNMTVQILEDVFKLTFFEVKQPIQIDQSEPLPQKVRADFVTSVIVTPGKLSQIINVLQNQLNNYKTRKQ